MAAHQVQARLSPQGTTLVGSWNMEHGELVDLLGGLVVVGSLLEAGEAATTFTFIPDHSPCSLTTPASVAILATAAASCRQLSPSSFYCLQQGKEEAFPSISACLHHQCKASLHQWN